MFSLYQRYLRPIFTNLLNHQDNGAVTNNIYKINGGNRRQFQDLSIISSKRSQQNSSRTVNVLLKNPRDIFRGSKVRCDIPRHSTYGIELLRYSRKDATKYAPKNRLSSDNLHSIERAQKRLLMKHKKILKKLYKLRRNSQNSLNVRNGISFYRIYRDNSTQSEGGAIVNNHKMSMELCTDIDSITETEVKRLQGLYWLELVSIFKRNHIKLVKGRSFKRYKRVKNYGVFGVQISTLTQRDQQISGNKLKVPLFLEYVLAELTKRGLREEGILRIGGNVEKIVLLYDELEKNFYQAPKKCRNLLNSASVHDLSALLKRWLRELPQPLLTNEYMRLFYRSQELPASDQTKALSIICQMLPYENRNTLRSLLRFLNQVVEQKRLNKMNLDSVATMIAPCLFPLRAVQPLSGASIEDELRVIAQCCCLVNILIAKCDLLFQVSDTLIQKLRCTNKMMTCKRNRFSPFYRFRRLNATKPLLRLRHYNHKKNNEHSNNKKKKSKVQ